jgi:disulfide bond formation protein DsbB
MKKSWHAIRSFDKGCSNVARLQINSPRDLSAAIVAVSVGSLLLAYTAQYGFGLEPCILCLYQRVPFAANVVLGLIALFMSAESPARVWILRVCGLAFLIGGGIAFYHVGVEQHWWQSAASCGGQPITGAITSEQLLQSLQQFQPKACDDVDWTLFGISMASYNVVFSLGLGILTFIGLRKMGTPS